MSIERIFTYAALADKYDGRVHSTLSRHVTLAMPEPIGIMGIICPDDFPLLGFISMVIPAITMGNRVVVVPSEKYPLIATDLYQIFDTSDVPGGTINIVTGHKEELAKELGKHLDVDGLWYHGTSEMSKELEILSAENVKRTWVNHGKYRDWANVEHSQGELFLRMASEIKNIWIPYGV
jgi:aldehyde dehydrogenase (NAD+)